MSHDLIKYADPHYPGKFTPTPPDSFTPCTGQIEPIPEGSFTPYRNKIVPIQEVLFKERKSYYG